MKTVRIGLYTANDCLKDDVLPETLSSLKIVLPGQKSSLTLDPLKQMVIITP